MTKVTKYFTGLYRNSITFRRFSSTRFSPHNEFRSLSLSSSRNFKSKNLRAFSLGFVPFTLYSCKNKHNYNKNDNVHFASEGCCLKVKTSFIQGQTSKLIFYKNGGKVCTANLKKQGNNIYASISDGVISKLEKKSIMKFLLSYALKSNCWLLFSDKEASLADGFKYVLNDFSSSNPGLEGDILNINHYVVNTKINTASYFQISPQLIYLIQNYKKDQGLKETLNSMPEETSALL